LPGACLPVLVTLTRVVVPVTRSRTNTSTEALVSPGTRVSAYESNRTYRPPALIDASPDRSLHEWRH